MEENTLLDMNFMEKRKGIPLPLHVGDGGNREGIRSRRSRC